MAQKTKQVMVRDVPIGAGARIAIQSMTNTDTRDVPATVAQIRALKEAGCDIVRISVYDPQCAAAIRQIKDQVDIPLVADIHFDHRLAILSAENGIDKLRINPGNIGSRHKVQELVDCAKQHHIPIRVGVNGGSLHRDTLAQFGGPTAEAIVHSALEHIKLLEACGFYDIVVSVKSSDVKENVRAYRMLSKAVEYPLHLGVTEAGTKHMGMIKSAIGIGALLIDGIGDTLRVSLSGDPVQEVPAARDILRAAGCDSNGVEIISCPTCGRCGIDVEAIALAVEERVRSIHVPIKAAVMGCPVNGPGEAKEADIGIAGAGKDAILFRQGEKIAQIPSEDAVEALTREILEIARHKGQEVGNDSVF